MKSNHQKEPIQDIFTASRVKTLVQLYKQTNPELGVDKCERAVAEAKGLNIDELLSRVGRVELDKKYREQTGPAFADDTTVMEQQEFGFATDVELPRLVPDDNGILVDVMDGRLSLDEIIDKVGLAESSALKNAAAAESAMKQNRVLALARGEIKTNLQELRARFSVIVDASRVYPYKKRWVMRTEDGRFIEIPHHGQTQETA